MLLSYVVCIYAFPIKFKKKKERKIIYTILESHTRTNLEITSF